MVPKIYGDLSALGIHMLIWALKFCTGLDNAGYQHKKFSLFTCLVD